MISNKKQERISLLLPTRQRRDMFKRFYDSAMELANHPGQVEVVYYVDDDDNLYDGLDLYNTTKISGPRIVLSEMWNKCHEVATGEIFGHMGDDVLFRTEGWDDIVRNTFNEYPDKIVFIWGSDGNPESGRNGFGTHGFLHRNWVDTVGQFLPPYYVSDYNDTHLNDVAKALGRHHYIDIITEHMHFSLGKSPKDQNTIDRLERHEKQKPGELYNARKQRIERQDEIEKLRIFIENFTI